MGLPSEQLRIAGLIALIAIANSCSSLQSGDVEENPDRSDFRPGRSIPFLAKEPDKYQADLTVKSFDGGQELIVRRYRIARDGTKSALFINAGTADEKIFLVLDDKSELVIDRGRKEYVRRELGGTGNSLAKTLTRGWLAKAPGTRYQELSADNETSVFEVRADSAPDSVTILHFDKRIGLPVRTEIYSGAGEDRSLAFSYRVSNFTTSVDASVFEIPEGFSRVGN